MIYIDSDNISYCNMRNLYKTGNGHGLQINSELENNKDEILKLCGEISDLFYKLQDLIGG